MKRNVIIFLLTLLLAFRLFGVTRNLIYLIPSGMGFSHITLMKYAFLRLPSLFLIDNFGFVTTHSANSYVTDQAAAGTALATGFKTINGFMGLDSLGKPVNNLFESAIVYGKSIGLLTESNLLKPLIVSFYAHAKNLTDKSTILTQLLENNPDVVFGKLDSNTLNIIESKLGRDVTLIKSKAELLGIEPWRIRKLFGIFSEKPANNNQIFLSDIMDKSLEILKRNPEGFVLIIEFGGIETSSLKNDTSTLLKELEQFDAIVKKALDFCQNNSDTLLVIVSPYEVGSPYITEKFDLSEISNFDNNQEEITGIYWTNNKIMANVTFVLAYGPGADRFKGFHNISHIPLLISDIMRLNLPSSFEVIK